MDTSGVIVGILIVLFGILNCFFGYTYFRVLLAFWGFIIGGVLTLPLLQQDIAPLTAIIIGVFGAMLGAALSLLVFRIGVFIAGAALGYTLVTMVLSATQAPENGLVLALVGGLIVGLLSLALNRLFIIALTAIGGAVIIITGMTMLFDPERIGQAVAAQQFGPVLTDLPPHIVLVWLLLVIFGILSQYRFETD
ncbi:MAG: hypothetical protein CL610_12145 [Anaerolineaceae bacterium]|nr:hypothetical protein [Anaerolineaceae bacterium]